MQSYMHCPRVKSEGGGAGEGDDDATTDGGGAGEGEDDATTDGGGEGEGEGGGGSEGGGEVSHQLATSGADGGLHWM